MTTTIAAKANFAKGILRFNNDDFLPGEMIATEGENIIWSSPLLQKLTSFSINDISHISYSQNSSGNRNDSYEVEVVFNADINQQQQRKNNDTLSGKLIELNDKVVVLNTWYGGIISVRKSMIQSLKIKNLKQPLYSGPKSSQEWQSYPESDSWNFQDRSLTSAKLCSIARNFPELTNAFHLRFHIEWEKKLNINLLLCTKDIKPESLSSHYMLTLDSGSISLQRKNYKENLGAEGLIGDYLQNQIIQNNQQCWIDVFVDRATGLISLFINDELIKEWTDQNLPYPIGKSIHIKKQTDLDEMKISHISLTPWDTTLSNEKLLITVNSLDNPKPIGNEKKMVLSNGDIILGDIKKIEGEKIFLATRYKNLELSLEKLKFIEIKEDIRNERVLKKGDVRAWFEDGSHITFRLDGITPEGDLITYSQCYGIANFNQSAFTRIDLHPYHRKSQH
jgi:hypothetical protein